MEKYKLYGVFDGKIMARVCDYESSLKSIVNALQLSNYCFVKPSHKGGWEYSFFKNWDFHHKVNKKSFSKLTKDEKDFLLKNEIENVLNRMWIARCKANDELIEYIAKIDKAGYTFKWSDKVEKQFEIIKKDK